MRLCDFCSFQTGFTVRGRLEPSRDGQLCLQLRDIQTDAVVDLEGLERFDVGEQQDRYQVKAGDVVFRSRGAPNVAWPMARTYQEPVIALLPLIILRPNLNIVQPSYLAWAINQPDAQRQLDAEAKGTGLRMITKASLEGIEVPVPDLNTQTLIAEVGNLVARERALLHQLADKREILTSRILSDAAKFHAQ